MNCEACSSLYSSPDQKHVPLAVFVLFKRSVFCRISVQTLGLGWESSLIARPREQQVV